MNKRKLLTLVLALTLVGAVGIGATLAYFTDKAEVANVITLGHVDITLTENQVDNTTGEYVQTADITEEGLTFDDVLPGQTVPKNPTITVADDSENCYVRATVTVESEDGISAEYLALLEDALKADITKEGSNWTYADGYYYYAAELTAEDAVVLFEEVTIPGEWDNAVADKSFSIKINAEAIQSVYVDDVVVKDADGNVTSWDLGVDEEGNPIVEIQKYEAVLAE